MLYIELEASMFSVTTGLTQHSVRRSCQHQNTTLVILRHFFDQLKEALISASKRPLLPTF